MKLFHISGCVLAAWHLTGCSSSPIQSETPTPTAGTTPSTYVKTHGMGDMAMSPNGEMIAFYTYGMDARQFALFDLRNSQSSIVELPPEFKDVGDLSWSPDGDELVFVASPTSVLGGSAKSVWRLHAETFEFEHIADLAYARLPVVSANGEKLALFEGVTGSDREYISLPSIAYGLFEIDLISGNRQRRSVGHFSTVWNLQYDADDNLYASIFQAVVPSRIPEEINKDKPFYWGDSDQVGYSQLDWERDTGRVWAFRVPSGAVLEQWPMPLPNEGAPNGSRAVRPTDDGRLIIIGSLDPENTHLKNTLRYYGGERRKSSKLMRNDYIAYGEDGLGEVLASRWLELNESTTGGADISADGVHFARVIDTHDRDPGRYVGIRSHNKDTLYVDRGGKLIVQKEISAILSEATKVVIGGDTAPSLTLVDPGPHRISVP